MNRNTPWQGLPIKRTPDSQPAPLSPTKEATERLEYWEKKKGLCDTRENADAIVEYLLNLNKGFTVETVDAAILDLTQQNKLMWKLKNGENPLPLDADEFTMKKASVEQLRNLSARRGEGKKQFRQGWHRAGDRTYR